MTDTALTSAGALKHLIENLGLTIVAYRDAPPADKKALPYVTIHEGISNVPDGSPDNELGNVRELLQVDLWQTPDQERSNPGAARARNLTKGLHGARVPGIVVGSGEEAEETVVFGCYVRGFRRLVESDGDVIHHALTVELLRQG